MAGFDLSNYVEVADRLREFYEKHPGGRVITSIVELTDKRVVVKAEVYRETAHAVPSGAGHSALGIPGITPYTKGAELENAETSAIGRALVAAGLASKKIASADEVRAKRADQPVAVSVVGDGPGVASPPPVAAAPSISDDEAIRFAAAAMGFAEADKERGAGVCAKHARPWKFKTGETGGKPWAFWSCGARDPEARKGWCDEKPSPSWIASQEVGR
jgi:hypothetical protein